MWSLGLGLGRCGREEQVETRDTVSHAAVMTSSHCIATYSNPLFSNRIILATKDNLACGTMLWGFGKLPVLALG